MQLTINKTLVLVKMIRERLNELRMLRTDVAKKERFFSEGAKQVEPPRLTGAEVTTYVVP